MDNFKKDLTTEGSTTWKFCKLRDFMHFLQLEEILMIASK
jgi:hypothetical protein